MHRTSSRLLAAAVALSVGMAWALPVTTVWRRPHLGPAAPDACAGHRVFGPVQVLRGVNSYEGTTTVTAGTIAMTPPSASPSITLGRTGALCVAGYSDGWVSTTWSPPAGVTIAITDPGGLNAVHVHGTVVVPAGGTVSVFGAPQRMPSLLLSGAISGTWTAGTLPAGTQLVQNPVGMPPGLYLFHL